jgi:nicotinate phosphoribosyltransferase
MDSFHTGPALLTDLYQLTMAYSYWKSGTGSQEAVFNLYYRKNPFRGGFSVACGLEGVINYLKNYRFEEDDLSYLATLKGVNGQPLFEPGFLAYLHELRFTGHLDGIPEGTMVFPQEPLLRVEGPILQCQLLETPLLNFINFSTLIATKAARLWLAAEGDSVIEFGLRRAQGVNGALTASRAAYVGGCDSTSNLMAGKLFGIPVKGTHAHSWVMAFESEAEAFRAYAEAMPNNCVFLVDTYDSLAGVDRAIETGRWLREQGHEMTGIRLDSGDLAYLSIEARRRLDAAGFTKAIIMASNDLDEHIISSLKAQGARIDVWGVGTRLVTGHDQPALGGIYKLAAIRRGNGDWRPTIKLSEQQAKITTPGLQQVRRFRRDGQYMADVIYDCHQGIESPCALVDPEDSTRWKTIPQDAVSEELLVPVIRKGKPVYRSPPLPEIRARTLDQLSRFHDGIKRFLNPHQYPVGLEKRLHELKVQLILEARANLEKERTAGS